MQLIAPLGTPASLSSAQTLSAVRGVLLAGFTTMLLPAAMAGPIFVPIRVIGKFHGTMPAHTPMGCFITMP